MTSPAEQRSFFRAAARSAELESEIAAAPVRFRVLTGDRPTGPLHLGHYFGTLANRVRLQNAGVQVMLLVADYQVITDRDAVDGIPEAVLDLLADYLAAGIEPARTTVFAHSAVPALNQLLLPFLGLVSVAELHRNPTVKAEVAAAGDRAMSGLMLTYPVHQAADILFCGANLVPVGRDQLPHLELTRTIARRFNQRYAADTPLFPEPEALLSAAPLLLGLDGHKMSKSRGNAIALRDDEDRTATLIRAARTDGERTITYEPERRPEVANLLRLASLCTDHAPEQIAEEIAGGGAAALKAVVIEAINERLRSLRRRRAELAADPAHLLDVLNTGNAVANDLAQDTLRRVRQLMRMNYTRAV
jgi:tryptophanyl-tRNA synthetase